MYIMIISLSASIAWLRTNSNKYFQVIIILIRACYTCKKEKIFFLIIQPNSAMQVLLMSFFMKMSMWLSVIL